MTDQQEPYLRWCPSLRTDRHSTLAEWDYTLGQLVESAITLQVDMHWDTGAPTEYVIWDGEVERVRLLDKEEAMRWAEATYVLESKA